MIPSSCKKRAAKNSLSTEGGRLDFGVALLYLLGVLTVACSSVSGQNSNPVKETLTVVSTRVEDTCRRDPSTGVRPPCSWGGAQREISQGPVGEYTVKFQGIEVVPRGAFGTGLAGKSVLIEGPIQIDMTLEGAALRSNTGLEFQGFDFVGIEDVWIKGDGSLDTSFDGSGEGIKVTGRFGGGPVRCSISQSRFTGLERALELGSASNPISAGLSANKAGRDPTGKILGNRFGIRLYEASPPGQGGPDISFNEVVGVQSGPALEIFGNDLFVNRNRVLENAAGLLIRGDRNRIRFNLIAKNSSHGLEIRGNQNILLANKIGVDDGLGDGGNQGDGLFLIGDENCIAVTFQSSGPCIPKRYANDSQRNQIAWNGGHGVNIARGSGNHIDGAIIGHKTAPSAERRGGNSLSGIRLGSASSSTVIRNTIITLNGENGILIQGRDNSNNVIEMNQIGMILKSGERPLPNRENGIYLVGGTNRNRIVSNRIGHNEENGVLVEGPSTVQNSISKNAILRNKLKGIENHDSGNLDRSPPTITVESTGFRGTTCSNCKVELFSDSGNQGRRFEFETAADGTGSFSVSHVFQGPRITCTTTDLEGNTSEFGCGQLGNSTLLFGDLNGDAKLDILDFRLLDRIIRLVDSPTADQQKVADLNADGRIDLVDLVELLNRMLSF